MYITSIDNINNDIRGFNYYFPSLGKMMFKFAIMEYA